MIISFVIYYEAQREAQRNDKIRESIFLSKTNQIESDLKRQIDAQFTSSISHIDFFRNTFGTYFEIDSACEREFSFFDDNNKYYYKCLDVVNSDVGSYIHNKLDEIDLRETLNDINQTNDTDFKIHMIDQRLRYHQSFPTTAEKMNNTGEINRQRAFIKAYIDAMTRLEVNFRGK